MRNWLAILITLVACKDRGVERMEAVKREVCACKDAACADLAMQRATDASIKPNPRTLALARDMVECRARLEAADRPTTDPDAEDSAGTPAGDQPGSSEARGSAAAAATPGRTR